MVLEKSLGGQLLQTRWGGGLTRCLVTLICTFLSRPSDVLDLSVPLPNVTPLSESSFLLFSINLAFLMSFLRTAGQTGFVGHRL